QQPTTNNQQPTTNNQQPMLKASIIAGIISSAIALVEPVFALQVRVNPDNPQLGDTISVWLQVDDPSTSPSVIFEGQTLPIFPTNGLNQYRALIPTTPLDRPGSLSLQVTGDGETRNLTLGLRDRSFNTQSIRVAGGGSNATELELSRVADFKATVTPEKFWNGAFLRPTRGSVSTVFGVRRYYNGVLAQDYYHRGVDYAASRGTPVVAPAAGRVVLVGREAQGFRLHGNTIGLDHGQGVLSIFLHLQQIDVKEGDFVQAGQKIGTVGATGAATGPHLHWGLYVLGEAVDPVPWRFQGID
ncbi:MAG: M23 family metallopeptidase, partial [Jaaginema sp. PMC 1079.18]|nr:M23 family metallopeptidase [Jaaginema sp. PMC 1080.18]MEC4853951.1 M23 family metallopeptidase [Jaaginema sp. PMC 1079.18]MEC4868277.1 M23 family metallopeptidase [Jaaginema sp. PMC 1078.18]